jgi:RNA polymerase sigma-70 factor (ECF subfamily)
LLERAGRGDQDALGELFSRYRERLRRMVQVRLDRRLRGRIDASDVLQEAFVEVARCLDDYLREPALPFFLWPRMIAGRKLRGLHRHHLGTRMRDAGRELLLQGDALPQASSVALAAQLLGRLTTPGQAAVRAELRLQVQEALDGMDVLDREILALRHFEQLSNLEAARVLDISEQAASNEPLGSALEDRPNFGAKSCQRLRGPIRERFTIQQEQRRVAAREASEYSVSRFVRCVMDRGMLAMDVGDETRAGTRGPAHLPFSTASASRLNAASSPVHAAGKRPAARSASTQPSARS